MEEKLIMLLSLDEYNNYDKEQLGKDILVRSALRVGYLAVTNPDTSFQWLGNEIKVDTDACEVKVYAKIKSFAADPSEYLK